MMVRERLVITDEEGQEVTVTRGGNILASLIIFDRPDLFERFPEEVQQALVFYQAAMNRSSDGDYEVVRKLLDQAFNSLVVK